MATDPNSTTTTTTNATAAAAVAAAAAATATPRPITPHAPNPQQPNKPNQEQPSSQPFLYPVSSSGRGFIPRGIRPPFAADTAHVSPPPPPYTLGYRANQGYLKRVTKQYPQHQHYQLGPTPSPPINALPFSPQYPHHPKAAPRSVASDSNGYKDTSTRERSSDEPCYVVRGRKVRITEDASLYALCRSWLKNGAHEEIQPQQKDVMKPLPKPLPASMVSGYMSNKKEEKDADELKENEESVEHLSASDLLKSHIKRAKKVRAQLREERLHRITRYRSRLRLLLPPPTEQFKNDTAAGN